MEKKRGSENPTSQLSRRAEESYDCERENHSMILRSYPYSKGSTMPKKRKLSEDPKKVSPKVEEKKRYVEAPPLTGNKEKREVNQATAAPLGFTLPKTFTRGLQKVIPCLPSSESKGTQSPDCPSTDFPPPGSFEYLLDFLKQCTDQVEVRGRDEVGIYRVSGNVKKLEELMKKYLRKKKIHLVREDIHNICEFFKRLIRKIKLIPTDRWTLFAAASRSNRMEEAVNGLKPFNRQCMALVILHLKRISGYEATTKMGKKNLAIVFTPTVVGSSRAAEENPTLNEIPVQQAVMNSLLTCSIDWEGFL